MTRPSPIDLAVRAGSRYASFIRRHLHGLARTVPNCPRDLSIALVGDATMSKLHVRFMNLAGPTDVLTFELDHDGRGRCTAGEVVVCVPEAVRQAKRHDTRVEHELLLYVTHGLLHLTGHDDHDESDYRRMHAAEDRILRKLGIGPVFAPGDRSAQPSAATARRRIARTSKKDT